ncbi:hypothetical protein ABPG74_010069 [Tetrahymena malaccensis]
MFKFTKFQASHIQNTQTRQSNQKILATPQINSIDSPVNQKKTERKKSIFQTKHNQIEFDYIVEDGKKQGLVSGINYEKQLSALHLNLRDKQVSQEFIQEYFTKSRAKSEVFIKQINLKKQKAQSEDNKIQISNQTTYLQDKSQSQLQGKEYEKKYDVAIKYFSVAYEYFIQKQTKRSISQITYICISMAECYLKLKKYSQSQGLINEARKRLSQCNRINFQKSILKKNVFDVDSILSNHLAHSKNQKLNLNQNYKNQIQCNSFSTPQNFQLTQSVQSNQSKKEKQKNQTNKFRNTFFELQSPILFKAALQNKTFLKQNFQNFTVSLQNNITRNTKRQLSSIDDINKSLEKKNFRRIKRISSAKLTFQNKDKIKPISPNSCKSNIQKCPSIICIDNKDTMNNSKQDETQQNCFKKINSKESIFQMQNNQDFQNIGIKINGFSKSQNSALKENQANKNLNQQNSYEQWSNQDQAFGEKAEERKRNISIDQQISSQKQNNQVKSSLFQKIHKSIQYLNRTDNVIDQKNKITSENDKKQEEGNSTNLQIYTNQSAKNQNDFLQLQLKNNNEMQIDANQEFSNTYQQQKQSKENSVFLSPNMSYQNTARPFINNLDTKINTNLNKSNDKQSLKQQPTSCVSKQEGQFEQQHGSNKQNSKQKKTSLLNFISKKISLFLTQNNKNTIQDIPEISYKLQNQLIFDEKDELFLPYSVLYMKISLVQGKFFKSQGERYFLKAASQFTDVLEYFDPNSQEDQYDPLDKLEAMKELLYIFQWYNCKEQSLHISEEINKMENSQVMREKLSRPLFFIDSFL